MTPTPVRTRFAPSPTGDLHLGNLRIAIFNYLFTRHHGGAFVIRVEDTDRDRNVEGSLESILRDLAWAGLTWEEGPDVGGPLGPYRQSEREGLHRDAALKLLSQGKVYRCFCADVTGAELKDRLNWEAAGGPPAGCVSGCQALDPAESLARAQRGEPHALRFPVPEGPIPFTDAVRGPVVFQGKDVGDFVVLRADGRATYNFAVVVDDVAMQITHVIRGAGHLSNTPKQVLLFQALEAELPVFAHLPMVLGPGRKKLSKRDGAAGVGELRAVGLPPEALMNYLSLLGWSPGGDREILTPDELVAELDLDRVGASDALFDPEKLRWVSQQHLAMRSTPDLVREVEGHLDRERYPELEGEALVRAVEAIRTRLQVAGDVNEALTLIFSSQAAREEALALWAEERRGAGEGLAPQADLLRRVAQALQGLEAWEAEALNRGVRAAGADAGVRGPALFHPVRLALCGHRSGPDLGLVLVALGRESALALLEAGAQFLAP